MWRTLIQVMALALTLESAIFLARGNLSLSAEVIAQLARTGWGHNLAVAKSLSMERADTWAGVVLLLIAFGLQMVNILWPIRWKNFEVSRLGAVLALLFSVLALLVATYFSGRLGDETYIMVRQILTSPATSEQVPK